MILLIENKDSSRIKRNLASLLAGSVLATSVNAQQSWFSVDAYVDVNPNVVQATVSNNSNSYWQCRGRVLGQYGNGVWLDNNFFFRVPPGQYRYGNVYSGDFYNFVNGDAYVECRNL